MKIFTESQSLVNIANESISDKQRREFSQIVVDGKYTSSDIMRAYSALVINDEAVTNDSGEAMARIQGLLEEMRKFEIAGMAMNCFAEVVTERRECENSVEKLENFIKELKAGEVEKTLLRSIYKGLLSGEITLGIEGNPDSDQSYVIRGFSSKITILEEKQFVEEFLALLKGFLDHFTRLDQKLEVTFDPD